MDAKREIESYAPLLELARPDLYRRNLFRVLGLPVTASTADARRQQKRLEMQRKLGVETGALRGGAFALDPAATEEELRSALERLNNPHARLLDELFWFWPLGRDGDGDAGLKALEEERVEDAAKLWAREAGAEGRGPIAAHNLAVLDHLGALDEEARPASEKAGRPQKDRQAERWSRALARWREVCRPEAFWERLRQRVGELNDAGLPPEVVDRIRETLPAALLRINAELALQGAEREDQEAARRHAEIARRAGFREGLGDEALWDGLAPLRNRINLAIEEAKKRWAREAQLGDLVVRELHGHVAGPLAVVDRVLEAGNPWRAGLRDRVADALLEGIRAYAGKTNRWAEARLLLPLATALAQGEALKAELAKELEALGKCEETANDWCSPGYWELPQEVLERLEAVRQQTKSGDFDGALRALAQLDPGVGGPLRRCAAFCLSIKGIRIYNASLDELQGDTERFKKLLEKLRGPNEGELRVPRRPDPNLPSYRNPPCPLCGLPFSSWTNFTWRNIALFWCRECDAKDEVERAGRKAAHRKQIETALEYLLAADELDPGDRGVQRELAKIREKGREHGSAIPGKLAAAKRLLETFPALAPQARVARIGWLPAEAAPAAAGAESARPAPAAQAAAGVESARPAPAAQAAAQAPRRRSKLRWALGAGAAAAAIWAVAVDWSGPSPETPSPPRAAPVAAAPPSGTAGRPWVAVPRPPSERLYGVWSGGASDAWAVGSNGTLLHWDGGAWSAFASGTRKSLSAAWGSGPKDVWAVGEDAVILRWNGAAWARAAGAASAQSPGWLHGVWGSGPKDVWAVGRGGALRHWNGTSWTALSSGRGDRLNGVWGSAADDAWAVGANGTALHWNGAAWAAAPSGTREELNAVWGASAKDVWAVGANSTLLHWNGAAWSASTFPGAARRLTGAWGSGPDDVWAVGWGALLHWDGTAWAVAPAGEGRTLHGIGGSGLDAAWAVGDAGTLLRLDGSTGPALASAKAAGAAPAPRSAAAPPGARTVTIRVSSTPSGAEVYEGGTRLSQTPLELARPASRAAELRFVLAGYRPETRRLDFSREQSVEVQLVRESLARAQVSSDGPRPPPAAREAKAPAAAPRPRRLELPDDPYAQESQSRKPLENPY